MPSEKSCGIVVFRESDKQRLYLILHYEEGHWDFPKGHVEAGEDERQTALRELKEETGIEHIELAFGFHESLEYSYKREGTSMHKEVVFFLGKTDSKSVKLSSEHIGFEWLAYEEALKRLTFENARSILSKAEKQMLTELS